MEAQIGCQACRVREEREEAHEGRRNWERRRRIEQPEGRGREEGGRRIKEVRRVVGGRQGMREGVKGNGKGKRKLSREGRRDAIKGEEVVPRKRHGRGSKSGMGTKR